MARYIFVTGGVVSSLGKGLSSASLAYLLQSRGFKVRIRKLDPYLNVDPGTMSPFQHGEVYVTDDGAETDLDLGHYERFSGVSAKKSDNITTGKIYNDVLKKERKGEYLGKTVQVIPHITDRIKEFIKHDTSKEDFVICEIGGIVGDIESLPFVEAIRQFSNDIGKKNALFIHLTLVPYIKASDEIKTKPTQHSVKELRSIGIQPDLLVCRSDKSINEALKKKLSGFCGVSINSVIEALDADSIYSVPLSLKKEGLCKETLKYLDLEDKKCDLKNWEQLIHNLRNPGDPIKVALVGKYIELGDAYLSVVEALRHACIEQKALLDLHWVSAEMIEKNSAETYLNEVDAIVVPGGFGNRGVNGKISAIKFAREYKIPFLGLCLGMQCAVIEWARNVANLPDASSSELDPNTPNPVIHLLPEQEDVVDLGGTMRLGAYPCRLTKNTTGKNLYDEDVIYERHRHRYEFNNYYKQSFLDSGYKISGTSPDGRLVELIELENHPYFLACQSHPEILSRPGKPHHLFKGLIKASQDKLTQSN